mgnify:CR=1 FL=1
MSGRILLWCRWFFSFSVPADHTTRWPQCLPQRRYRPTAHPCPTAISLPGNPEKTAPAAAYTALQAMQPITAVMNTLGKRNFIVILFLEKDELAENSVRRAQCYIAQNCNCTAKMSQNNKNICNRIATKIRSPNCPFSRVRLTREMLYAS